MVNHNLAACLLLTLLYFWLCSYLLIFCGQVVLQGDLLDLAVVSQWLLGVNQTPLAAASPQMQARVHLEKLLVLHKVHQFHHHQIIRSALLLESHLTSRSLNPLSRVSRTSILTMMGVCITSHWSLFISLLMSKYQLYTLLTYFEGVFFVLFSRSALGET